MQAAFKNFLKYYHGKYGEGKTFTDFIETIFDNMKRRLHKQERIVEPELVGFIEYLKKREYVNKSIRVYLAGIQN